MSWSSNNGDDSPWGKNSKDNSKSSYNGSGRKNNNDDFFDNFQDRLKNFFPKKNPTNHVDESYRLNLPQQTNITLDRKLTVDLPELVFGN